MPSFPPSPRRFGVARPRFVRAAATENEYWRSSSLPEHAKSETSDRRSSELLQAAPAVARTQLMTGCARGAPVPSLLLRQLHRGSHRSGAS
jgi:hypothetical protein